VRDSGGGNDEWNWRGRVCGEDGWRQRAVVRQRLNGSPARAQFTVRGKWEKMGLDGTVSKGPGPVSQDPATKRLGVGGAVVARRTLLTDWILCREDRPIPAPLEPRESGCRATSRCLILDRDVPFSRRRFATLQRRAFGERERTERAPTPTILFYQTIVISQVRRRVGLT